MLNSFAVGVRRILQERQARTLAKAERIKATDRLVVLAR
jgi:hypothetical protein